MLNISQPGKGKLISSKPLEQPQQLDKYCTETTMIHLDRSVEKLK